MQALLLTNWLVLQVETQKLFNKYLPTLHDWQLLLEVLQVRQLESQLWHLFPFWNWPATHWATHVEPLNKGKVGPQLVQLVEESTQPAQFELH